MSHVPKARVVGRKIGLTVIVALAFAGFAAATAMAKPTKVVSMDGQSNWHVQVTAPGGSATFENGPALTQPVGEGSAHLVVPAGSGDESVQLRSTGYSHKRLSDLVNGGALSYWAYVHTNNGQQAPYIILNVDYTGDDNADDLLFFEPPFQQPGTGNAACPDQGAVEMDRWQGWDAKDGCWYAIDTNTGAFSFGAPGTGVLPLSDYVAAHPKARIVNSSSTLGGIRLLVGFASPGDAFDASLDSARIGFGKSRDLYDFDPAS